MRLVYNKPADRWGEALPLGNGLIGAMVFAGACCEKINLTENTFYSGQPECEANQPGASEAFMRMRRAEKEGAYDRVHEEARQFIGRRENYGTHLPTGDLYVSFNLGETLTEYERGLDIAAGKAWVLRSNEKNRIREEVCVSHPDKVLALHIKAEKQTDLKIWFEPHNQEGGAVYEAGGMRFWADAFETVHCDERVGVHLEGAVRVRTDGQLQKESDGIAVLECTEAEIYLAMETDFGNSVEAPDKLYEAAKARCAEAKTSGMEALIGRHEEDMRQLTQGMKLEIQGTDAVSEKIPFLFQYGRYLLFCSSREDSVLPAHLQGIWNDNVACRIGWTCDMHLDINTQMNYWPAEFSGLTKTTTPLFRWIKEILVPEGRKTAAISYGQSGWVGELVSNAWGFAAPYWASPIAPCPTGGVWILTHMWEHFLYTQDTEFLEREAFPLIEEAVQFFEGYVYETEDGRYTCGPSISPENSFLYEGKPRQISAGCTYEILMIRELFEMYLEAEKVLGIEENERSRNIRKIHDKLLPYRILENGCIAEWNHDLPEADPQHRHTSHLLGLYPFAQITPEETPKLCEAAGETIQRKLTPPENWEDTGWARSMLMLYEARLQNAEEAYRHICSMVEHLLEPNQMVYHPPTRGAGAFDHVYELDGNTGLTSCIGEMLVQSHRGRIHLLPALPKEWKSGKVSGFHARGNVVIDLEWEDGSLKKAVLKSAGKTSQVWHLVWGEKRCNVKAGESVEVTAADFE